MRIRLLILIGGFITMFIAPSFVKADNTQLVILIRHAEKEKNERPNPSLSKEGQQRALALTETLKDTEIKKIITTSLLRTQQTIAPLAELKKIQPIAISVDKGLDSHISETVEEIKRSSANTVVAGHSDTIPLIIAALGGPKLTQLCESDYDNLFILIINHKNKQADLVKGSFGSNDGDNNC